MVRHADHASVGEAEYESATEHIGLPGAIIGYPTALSGNSDGMTATTNWADVSAFDTKDIVASSFLHLKTIGSAKDQRVRYTLPTPRAAAFDLRFWGIIPDFVYWSTGADAYFEILGTDSGGSAIFMVRARSIAPFSNTRGYEWTTGVSTTAILQGLSHHGETVNFRVTRDGGNLLGFYIGHGPLPVGFARIWDTSDNTPYDPSSAGTLARIEFSIHTVSGAGASAEHHVYVDAYEDV